MKTIFLELEKRVLRSWGLIPKRGRTDEILQGRMASATAGWGGRIPNEFRRTSARILERAGVPRNTETIGRHQAIVPGMDPLDGITQREEYCSRFEPESRRPADGQWLGKAKRTYRQLTVKHCNLART